MKPEVMVFGPAYLDRVLRVDGPLAERPGGPPLDQSTEGVWRFAAAGMLRVLDPAGNVLEVIPPGDWPGPFGEVEVAVPLGPRTVRGVSWSDDLGGMGAGFASALGGKLICPLGEKDEPAARNVENLLSRYGITAETVPIANRPADWTLLLTSGAEGDKLAIGVRETLAAVEPGSFARWLDSPSPCGLRVVAGLPNLAAAQLLSASGARCRLFAPAMRNMVDRTCPVSSFAGSLDVLCCNRQEWEALDDREETAWRVSILVITDGPLGASARFTQPDGDAGTVQVPAFPRDHPPRDTNRAGEAFAAALISTLLAEGWEPASGVVGESLVRNAMLRASVASSLVLDLQHFGFASPQEIDRVFRTGRVR